MSLNTDIVIVNEYSIPLPGGKGSRGGTPGDYVTRYMARERACEPLAPIQRTRTDNFIMRYMVRDTAVETLETQPGVSRNDVKIAMKHAHGDGGVAFGYGSLSLSHEQLTAASHDIQHLFDSGKTVLKTVLSFSEDYLKRHGIVDPDFHCSARGDYRGHIDQMKLRMAIMHGLDRMSAELFDDLRYIGVIQVDTEHVHCHLAMVDAGVGTITRDGTQRGKLLDRHKSRLRRGVDAWLDDHQMVARLSSAVGYERRNVISFIKRWTFTQIAQESLPQLLVACLPSDRSLWRAASHDRRMRKANQIATDLVTHVLDQPDSPMSQAMEPVIAYANRRRETEQLTTDQWHHLIDTGKHRIIERSVNAVYQMIRSIPDAELRVRTPMLDIMSMDYDQLVTLNARMSQTRDDDTVAFGLRLRSYSSRLRHHTRKSHEYDQLAHQWEQLPKTAHQAHDSYPLYQFYLTEREYHRQLMSKYQFFLPFVGDVSDWFDRVDEIAHEQDILVGLRALRADVALGRMRDSDKAEEIAYELYHCAGGHLLTQGDTGRAILDERITAQTDIVASSITRLVRDLADVGLILQPATPIDTTPHTSHPHVDETDLDMTQVQIVAGTRDDFQDVKALDLHHLGYDFATDVTVGSRSCEAFWQMATRRHNAIMGALTYLDSTEQAEMIPTLPVDDVAAMMTTATTLTRDRDTRQTGLLVSQLAQLRQKAHKTGWWDGSTTPLDEHLHDAVRDSISRTITTDVTLPTPDTSTHQTTELE